MRDIENRADIEKFVKEFYNRALKDERIGPVFTDIAKINLEKHLPIIADFWESSLFHTIGYRNDLLDIHRKLGEKARLNQTHFERWLMIFDSVIDEFFEGPMAVTAKNRALSIATVIQLKM